MLISVGLAEALSGKELDQLSGEQHQKLLTFLCDEALDSEILRDVLQERLEGSGDVKREMREAVAEKKGELKVIILGPPPPPPFPLSPSSLPPALLQCYVGCLLSDFANVLRQGIIA